MGNNTVTIVKAQTPFIDLGEDYFEFTPEANFIGKRIKWSLNTADTMELKGSTFIKQSVNITELYSDLKYPVKIQTKFPIHVKKANGDISTNYKIRSNVLTMGLVFEERQFNL